ncbi:DUF4133 domain-containing protein [Mucilaginibacter sp. dw_454]|uniref:DUF4133 domain-containing protein n=1 Tax=Mucilaginibacter sp. dw_454 TaxID=2720079 RepID=UPI001BD2F25B|nr:DUF4133 domain-containing protein [Mucilaginibacter sp. dw_454]
MAARYAVYKGLQRPLTFKGFKGKYIYWGLGSVLAGLVLGSVTMAMVNMWLGAIVLVGFIVGGLVFIASKQKGGLHAKARHTGIYVYPSNLKNLRYGRQKSI